MVEIRGYDESEIVLSRYNPISSDLLITFVGTEDSIHVRGGLGSRFNEIETIRIKDGPEFSLAEIQQKVLDTQLASSAPGLFGTPGADELDLNSNIRIVDGGDGNDVAVFTAGDGPKFIFDSEFGTTDTLRIVGYTPDQVVLDFEPHTKKDIIVRFQGTDEYIYMVNAVNAGGSNGFQQIQFEDGTLWDNDQLEALAAAAPSEYFRGNNRGNDTFTSTAANEYFEGLGRTDTYNFEPGFGFDVVRDSGAIINLNNISLSDVTVSRTSLAGNDVAIIVNATGDTLILEAAMIRTGMNVYFGDGQSWNNQQIRDAVFAAIVSDGDDYIQGSDDPSDTVSGGRGNDYFNGQTGSDTYIFNRNDGRDTITDSGTFGADTVHISGYSYVDAPDWQDIF